MHDDKRNLDSIPVGSLGIIPLESCAETGSGRRQISRKMEMRS